MAEGFLRSFDPGILVYSAGTDPAGMVHPKAVKVMGETGIDISAHNPKMVDEFLSDAFDYVITVCDNARENCPVFTGNVKHRLHIGFEDPAEANGSEAEIIGEFRRMRDENKERMSAFYLEQVKNQT